MSVIPTAIHGPTRRCRGKHGAERWSRTVCYRLTLQICVCAAASSCTGAPAPFGKADDARSGQAGVAEAADGGIQGAMLDGSPSPVSNDGPNHDAGSEDQRAPDRVSTAVPPLFDGPLAYVPAANAVDDLAVADMDGDGVLDMVTANARSGQGEGLTVSVFLGVGDGSFTVVHSEPLSEEAGLPYIALGDFNGDGAVDLAARYYDRRDGTLLYGAGDGTLGSARAIDFGATPKVLTIADLDGDGFDDALTLAGELHNNVNVAFGDDAGTLERRLSLSAAASGGSVADDIAVGDVNGDGALDLLTITGSSGTCAFRGEEGTSTVHVLLGDGKGAFAPPTSISALFCNANRLVVGDFNGDGYDDALLASDVWGLRDASVFLGASDGKGSIVNAAPSGSIDPLEAASSFQAAAVGDLNSDGTLDVVLLTSEVYGSQAYVTLSGVGDGRFTVGARTPMLSTALALARLDDDRTPDLLLVRLEGDVYVHLGQSDGSFSNGSSRSLPVLSEMVLADFNGDGLDDLVTSQDVPEAPRITELFIATGAGGFEAAPLDLACSPIAAADVDGDGALDIVCPDGRDGRDVLCAKGNGDGTFAEPIVTPTKATFESGFAVADLDGDAVTDVLGFDRNGGHVLLGRGDGTFVDGAHVTVATVPYYDAVALGDIDGNGTIDVAVTQERLDQVSIQLGSGDGTFRAADNVPVGDQPMSIALGDIDGNGTLDLVTSNDNSADVSVRLGLGDGGFASAGEVPVGGLNRRIVLGDVNGDGLLDFVTGPSPHVFLGRGDGTFVEERRYGVNMATFVLNDLNRDGLVDIVGTGVLLHRAPATD